MRTLTLAFLAAFSLMAAPALAAEPVPGDQAGELTLGSVSVLGPVHVVGDHARVRVRYTCPATDDHLWVSVKQSRSGRYDAAVGGEGSGGENVAATWWMSHAAGPFICDGKRHTGRFTVNGAEVAGMGRDAGHLRRGVGFVQFCLTHETQSEDLQPDFVIQQKWVKVVVNRKRGRT